MTGRIPSQHGVHDWIRHRNMPPNAACYLEGFTCYTDLLAAAGYTCGLSGKWHLGDSITPQHGFKSWLTIPYGGSNYNSAELICNGEVSVVPGYLSDIFTDEAIRLIGRRQDVPFYVSVHYNAPHSPWTGHPQDIVDSYDDCPFESCPQEAMHPSATAMSRDHLGNRESLKGYFAAVTAMDAGVGRIIDRIEELGLRESTLIVFTSDNGYSCGHHGFWGKGNGTFPLNMYENSVKVPFIVSQPGRIPQGRISHAMVSQYDFMPTLLDYLGLPPVQDETLPGVSCLPVRLGQTDEAREEVVVYDEYGPVRMVRTREWKYVHRYPYGPHELFDLVNDPDEGHNLVTDEPQAPRMGEMRARLARWFARYVDPVRDGLRANVNGLGQAQRIDREHPAEEAGTDEAMYTTS